MGCPYSEHGGEAAFPGYCVLHTCSRRGGRHHHDGHDEATRWWFGQAGRQRPSRAHCGLSATATTPSQGGRETTPPAVHWSVRERSNGRQGCRKCSANIFHGATRGSRVAVSRHQVQRGPTDAAAVGGGDDPVRLPVSRRYSRRAQYADCARRNRCVRYGKGGM